MTGTETVQSFNTLNYAGLLYTKSNKKTPFLNMISGHRKYTNSVEFITGQFYENEDAEIPAISETASLTAKNASFVTRSQKTNVTQIFMEAVAISYAKQSNMGTLSGVNIAGQVANPQNELDFQVARKMETLSRSIEKTFIQGTYNKATSDSTINKTRGMNEAITTNVISAESGSGDSKVNKPLDIWLINDAQQAIYDNQGDISNLYLWTNTVGLNQLNADALKWGMKMGEPYMSAYGVQVYDVILPLGVVHVALGEFIPSGTAFLFNFDVIGPVEQPVPGKGNFFLEELAKTGAGTKYQIFGQIGLDHGPEWMHAKITGLKTTFDKPEAVRDVKIVNASELKATEPSA